MIIDWNALSARYSGRQAFIDKLIDVLLESQAETPAKLRHAASVRDFEAIRFIAHNLKGMAGNIESIRLRTLALQVEEASRTGQENAPESAERLAGVLAELLGHLEAYTQQRRQE